MNVKMKLCDYISVSVPVECHNYFHEKYFWIDGGPEKSDVGFRGYHNTLRYTHGFRAGFSEGRKEIHYDLPGRAVDRFLPYTILSFVRDVLSCGGNVSRFDFCVDVSDYVPMSYILDVTREGHLVTKAKKVSIIETSNPEWTENLGGTIYLGSRTSGMSMRIYDKAKQLGIEGNLVRFEAELRSKKAFEYCKQISLLENDDDDVKRFNIKLMNNYVQYRELDNERTDRRTVCSWYAKIFGFEKVKIIIEKAEDTIAKMRAWVENQVSATLSTLKYYYGERYVSVLREIENVGIRKMKTRHMKLIEENKNEKNFGLVLSYGVSRM